MVPTSIQRPLGHVANNLNFGASGLSLAMVSPVKSISKAKVAMLPVSFSPLMFTKLVSSLMFAYYTRGHRPCGAGNTKS